MFIVVLRVANGTIALRGNRAVRSCTCRQDLLVFVRVWRYKISMLMRQSAGVYSPMTGDGAALVHERSTRMSVATGVLFMAGDTELFFGKL